MANFSFLSCRILNRSGTRRRCSWRSASSIFAWRSNNRNILIVTTHLLIKPKFDRSFPRFALERFEPPSHRTGNIRCGPTSRAPERRPPEGPGPQPINGRQAQRFQGRATGAAVRGAAATAPSGGQKISPFVNFDSCPLIALDTICGFALGELLNLLWLGRKILIFREGPFVPCGYRGTNQEKPPARREFGLVSAPWHRVEQKQNKPSQNGQ